MKTPKLGQHFLKNTYYAHVLAESLHTQSGEPIVEIGPGRGILTEALLKTGSRVIAIEKDADLIPILNERFKPEVDNGRLQIVLQDVRDFDPHQYTLTAGEYVVGANIPYYITGEIVRLFLTHRTQPRAMSLLVQKEVAQRAIAPTESLFSLSIKLYGTPKVVTKVAAGNFSPPPRVDSAILLIDAIHRPALGAVSEEEFFSVLRAGFASKRKKLSTNLRTLFSVHTIEKAFSELAISPHVRAEQLPLSTWIALIQHLIAMIPSSSY